MPLSFANFQASCSAKAFESVYQFWKKIKEIIIYIVEDNNFMKLEDLQLRPPTYVWIWNPSRIEYHVRG